MSTSSRWGGWAAVALGLVTAGVAFAVHDVGLFELDKNAIDDPNVPGEDWSTLYAHAQDPATNPTQAVAVVSPMPLSDAGRQSGTALLDPIFKSSADVNPITTWNWVVADATKAGQLPPKDNITNAYAAAYMAAGKTLTYFGMDRLTANGTSDIGFWFLKRPVSLVPADPACPPDMLSCTGSFAGQHEVGDTLVLSAFTNGGAVDTIEVYKWVGAGGNAGGGVLQLQGSGVDCLKPGLANDPVCATVNAADETAPWPYLAGEAKSVPGIFPPNHFFEGGIDLQALGLQGCFTTFLAETRSSSSLTAQLKDFVFGEFPLCGIAVDKTGDLLSKEGDEVHYKYTITNTGAMPLRMRSVVDDKAGDLTSAAAANGCLDLAAKASCTFEVPFTIPAGAFEGENPYVNVVQVSYFDPADPDPATALAYTASDSHSVDLFKPAIRLTKGGDALSKIGDEVGYTITLYNDSSANSPDLVCTVSDPIVGLAKSVTLAAGASQAFSVSGFVIPAGAADPFVNTATATCSPLPFPNVLTADASFSTNLFQPEIALASAGNALSKIGDLVTYTLTLENKSSADTPDLVCTITSSLPAFAKQVTLASGAKEVLSATFAIPEGAPDPFVNSAKATCQPTGFPNVLTKDAGWSTDLFQPSIALAATGDALSKVGDAVTYSLMLMNTSSADTPALACAITSTLPGFAKQVTLASGENSFTEVTFTIPEGAPDPFVASAHAACSPTGFPNVLTKDAGWETNLFQPAIAFEKTSTFLFSKAGDVVPYTLTLVNASSADTPALVCTVEDALLGVSWSGSLASGGTKVIEAAHLVTAEDADPLVNTATATCSPVPFPNVLSKSSSWTVDLLHPAFTVAKACNSSAPYPASGPVAFTITYANTGDADLAVASPECGPFELAVGTTHSCVYSMTGPFSGTKVTNTESAIVTMAARYGLDNSWNATASASCDVGTAKIAPTQTTCQDFVSGTAGDLTEVLYGVKSGLINNAAPGVFFYYSFVRAPASGLLTVDVRQQITTGNFSTLFNIQQAQLRLYNADCTAASGSVLSLGPGDAIITIPAVQGQVFVVSAKYDTMAVVGKPVPNPTTVHYSFATLANGTLVDSDADGLNLAKK